VRDCPRGAGSIAHCEKMRYRAEDNLRKRQAAMAEDGNNSGRRLI
jgi:hypothetical protein